MDIDNTSEHHGIVVRMGCSQCPILFAIAWDEWIDAHRAQ